MSFANPLDVRKSIAFRMTLIYAGLFIGSAICLFFVFYTVVRNDMARRMDDDLLEEIEEVKAILQRSGPEDYREVLSKEAEFDGVEKSFIRLFNRRGDISFSSNLSAWQEIEKVQSPKADFGPSEFQSYRFEGVPRGARVLTKSINGGDVICQVGLSTDEGAHLLESMRETFVSVMLVVVAVATLVGWLMAQSALQGIEQATLTALKISQGDLSSRVPVKGRGDEIDRLADAFNTMVQRLQVVLTSMKETTDNIAHDLRSPIARIRGRSELALTRNSHGGGEVEALAADTMEECDRVLTMINTMLDISELETGVAKIERSAIDVGELIQETCEIFEPAAELAGVELTAQPGEGVEVRGDIHSLQRALANIVDNAIKYTPEGGKVSITMDGTADDVEIMVRDTGTGIEPGDVSRIFDRFYRGDRSRSQRGNGLGLSLSLAIVGAHGGEITVDSEPGRGCRVTIRLPRLSADASALPT